MRIAPVLPTNRSIRLPYIAIVDPRRQALNPNPMTLAVRASATRTLARKRALARACRPGREQTSHFQIAAALHCAWSPSRASFRSTSSRAFLTLASLKPRRSSTHWVRRGSSLGGTYLRASSIGFALPLRVRSDLGT